MLARGGWLRLMVLSICLAGLAAFGSSAAHGQPGPQSPIAFSLVYDADVFNVVRLGRVRLEGVVADGSYSALADLQTVGFAAIFERTSLSAAAQGVMTDRGPQTQRYDLSHSYAEKFRRVQIRRDAGRVTVQAAPRYGDLGATPATDRQRDGSLDPVSALVRLSLQIGQDPVCRGGANVFDGRQHYQLRLSGGRRQGFDGGGYRGEALVCTLDYVPVSGFSDMSPQALARIPRAEIWFAAREGFSPPLRIALPTPVGEARLTLVEYSLE